MEQEWVKHEKSATGNECNMNQNHGKKIEKMLQKKCTTRGKCNLKRVQNERVQRGKIATRNEYNTKIAHHEVSAT